MTLTKYSGQYEELFSSCVWYSDGSLNSDGTLANLINSSLSGTITGATKTGTDRFGNSNKAIVFTNTTDTINTGSTTLIGTGSYTAIMWAKSTSAGGQQIITNSNNAAASVAGLMISINPAINAVGVIHSDGSSYIVNISGTTCTQLNAWVCYAVRFSAGTSVSIFSNGNLNYTYSTSTTTHANPYTMRFGKDYSRTDNTFAGNMGEALLYARVLSDTEIITLYNLTSKKYITPLLSGIRGTS